MGFKLTLAGTVLICGVVVGSVFSFYYVKNGKGGEGSSTISTESGVANTHTEIITKELDVDVTKSALPAKPEYSEALYEGWSVYTDDEFGYSLRVPPGWLSKGFSTFDAFKMAFGKSDGVLSFIGESESYKVYEFGCDVVTVSVIPTKFSAEGTVASMREDWGIHFELKDATRSEVVVGARKAIQFDESIFPSNSQDRNPQFDGFTTFVKQGDTVLMFAGRSCATEKEQYQNFYEMMLVSVQFFDVPSQTIEKPVVDASAWPLYTHPELGYSIRMHPDFQRRSDAEKFSVFTDRRKGCNHTGTEDNKWVAAYLDINIFTYGASNFPTSREEAKGLYEQLLVTADGTELTVEEKVVLKIKNFNLDGRLFPQVFVGGYNNTYVTNYSGDRQFLAFEFEGDCLEDVEKYQLLLNASFSTFRFNTFNP